MKYEAELVPGTSSHRYWGKASAPNQQCSHHQADVMMRPEQDLSHTSYWYWCTLRHAFKAPRLRCASIPSKRIFLYPDRVATRHACGSSLRQILTCKHDKEQRGLDSEIFARRVHCSLRAFAFVPKSNPYQCEIQSRTCS